MDRFAPVIIRARGLATLGLLKLCIKSLAKVHSNEMLAALGLRRTSFK